MGSDEEITGSWGLIERRGACPCRNFYMLEIFVGGNVLSDEFAIGIHPEIIRQVINFDV